MPPLLIVGIALAAAGTAVGVVGQVKAGNAAARAGEYNANLDTEQAGDAETNQRLQDSQIMAHNRALVGASGVVANSGSPLDVAAQNAKTAETNALLIRRQGQLSAYAAQTAGQQAKTAADFGAVGSILSGGAGITQQIIKYKQATP